MYFLDVPTGTRTSPKLVARQSGLLLQTVDKPFLLGRTNGFGFYDRAFSRWIPADIGAVSPDGTHYAYASGAPGGPNELHIVDVRTGVDRLAVNGGKYYPLDYTSGAIYLSERNGGSGLPSGSGLFRLDLSTNAIRQLHNSTRIEYWSLIFGGFAYGSDVNPADPNPNGLGGASNELVRLDLATGAVVRFQYHPGKAVYVLGITPEGQLLAEVGAGQPQIIDAAGKAKSIPGAPADAFAFIDSRLTWLLTGGQASSANEPRNASLYAVSNGRAVHQMDFQWGPSDALVGACR